VPCEHAEVAGPPPLRTERLLLRPHRLEDLDDLVRFHSDPEVVRWIPWPVRDRAATEETLRVKLGQGVPVRGEWLVLAAELLETGTVIGEVLLKWDGEVDRQGELGFAFGREHQGHGYAAEAARALVGFGFDQLGLRRVVAVCIEQNLASARLLQHLGFRLEERRVDVLHKGERVAQLVLALTAEEWRREPVQPDGADRLPRTIDAEEKDPTAQR
jgi:RimJ/RimL family protein N-acetyltransferase